MGSRLHGLLEKHGVAVTEHPEFELLDDETQSKMVRLIAAYLEDYDKVMTVCEVEHHREIELDLRSYHLPDCDFGTADRLDINRDTWVAELFDYKFGMWAVDDAETNLQMILYVLGVFANFTKVVTVNAHILQPGLDTVSTATFHRADIPRLLLLARVVADNVKHNSGKIHNVVFDNCLWCDNKANCPAMTIMARRAGVEIMPQWEDQLSALPDMLTDDVLLEHGSMAYDWAKLMEAWGEQMKRRITNFAMEGTEIRGKVLRVVGGRSTIVDGIRAAEITAKFTKTKFNNVIAEAAVVNLTKLKDYVAARAPQGSKGASEKELLTKLQNEGLLYVGGPSRYLVDAKQK